MDGYLAYLLALNVFLMLYMVYGVSRYGYERGELKFKYPEFFKKYERLERGEQLSDTSEEELVEETENETPKNQDRIGYEFGENSNDLPRMRRHK